ncbi:MAG: phosphoribosylformylglycinamidine synthase I [Candidatus Gracilibacteria bacterium]
MNTPKIAVILFPGTNCELEAVRACKRVGMNAEILRWNEDVDLKSYDGFILPGGFSYEDRGRSGIIASKDPIITQVIKEASKGKPLIGICNGAQMLVESGVIPGLEGKKLEMALAWNERIKNNEILGIGFYNDWIYLKSDAPTGRCAFNMFDKNTLIKCPVAHGEGRYITQDKALLKTLIENEQTIFRYCDENGKFINEFPVNPNNAIHSLAGVCNADGNIMALMPHPERTINGDPVFVSMKKYITGEFKITTPSSAKKKYKGEFREEKIGKYNEKYDIEMLVELIITDNEERTIENALKDMGFIGIQLKKYSYFGIKTEGKTDKKSLIIEAIKSGELINTNKELPYIKIDGIWHEYDANQGLIESKFQDDFEMAYFVFERNNYMGKNAMSGLKKHFGIKNITEVKKGLLWVLKNEPRNINAILETHIFHNPHSSLIYSK